MREIGLLVIILTACTTDAYSTPRVELLSSKVQAVTLIVHNDGAPCQPIWLYPQFGPASAISPAGLEVSLTVKNESGEVMKPARTPSIDVSDAHGADVFRLECGGVIGLEIEPSSWIWGLELTPGRYRVSACVSSKLAEYLDNNDGFREEFEESRIRNFKSRAAGVIDWASCSSSEIQFEKR